MHLGQLMKNIIHFLFLFLEKGESERRAVPTSGQRLPERRGAGGPIRHTSHDRIPTFKPKEWGTRPFHTCGGPGARIL